MTTSLPQSNVRLTLVQSPGHGGDYDRPPGNPTTKWQGSVGAYLQEKIVRNLGTTAGGEANRVRQSTLILPGDMVPRIDLGESDLLTYEYPDGATRNWLTAVRVVETIATALPPQAGLPTTVRVSLVDAPV